MADEPQTPDPAEDGISEDDLRKLIGEELDSRLSKVTEGFGGIVDGIVEKLKGEAGSEGSTVSEDSLMEKIGNMIDEKLKGVSNGNVQKPREPKIRIFGS
jgi:hypothetical protein